MSIKLDINSPYFTPLSRTFKIIIILGLSFVIAACGTDSGPNNSSNPQSPDDDNPDLYNGPVAQSEDAKRFQDNLWKYLLPDNRCGSCHNEGSDNPFVHGGDINIAHQHASALVNREDPGQSELVQKVANGHNCWASDGQGGTNNEVCETILTGWVSDWVGDNSASANEIVLRSPQIKDPGASKSFPEDTALYSSTVYPLVSQYCSACHIEGMQTPFIGSSDIDTSYSAVKSRIDLETPSRSRIVERLAREFHNCWEVGCEASAVAMETAITNMSDGIEASSIDEGLVTSKALKMNIDGIVANSGGRYEDDVIALYEFKSGKGVIANDTSGVEPALDLTLSGNVEWVGGWGIKFGPSYRDDSGANIPNGKAQGSTTASKKIYDELSGLGEYSIEAWVVPGNVTQENARIVTYSGSSEDQNFALNQSLYNYEFYNTTNDKNPALATADADERLQASLQHVVATYSVTEGRKLYVNGKFTEDNDAVEAGLLNGWNESYAFVLGNETNSNELWEGSLRLVAIHKRALTQEQISQNYNSGVGEKFYLLFGISHLIDEADPNTHDDFIFFEVSQFDSHSYLFADARFVSLNDSASPENNNFDSVRIQGMKIAINGKEASVGQVFANMDITLNSEEAIIGTGQSLSNLGTIIPLEQGADFDEFFLSFDSIASHTSSVEAPPEPVAAEPEDLPASSEIGLKTFDEINASMSVMTGVPSTETAVADTFTTIKQQLPSVENIEGFLSAHQMAITQLAIQYCDVLVENSSLRSTIFGSFNFSESANTAFDTEGLNQITSSLINNFVGDNLDSQPSNNGIIEELTSSELNSDGRPKGLIPRLTSCAISDSCPNGRTATVVKAACAALLGSATTLIQ